jgi:hypothetical protein
LPEALSFVDGSSTFLGQLDRRPAENMREQTPGTCLLDHAAMPRVLLAKYASQGVHRMPDLRKLDTLVTSPEARQQLQCMGGTLANRYSNPNFVRDEWIKKKEEENRELAKAKEAKKQEKKAKRAVKQVDKGEGKVAEKKKAFNWKDRYIYIICV